MTRGQANRVQRGARRGLEALALVLLFVASLSLGLVLHLDTRPFRAAAAHAANLALADLLYGRIEVEGITHLSLSRIRLREAQLEDEYGNRVLQLQDVAVLLPDRGQLWRLILDPRNVNLHFPHARAERAWVGVFDDPTHGGVSLERALTPRPTAPGIAKPDRQPPRVEVAFEQIELGRVRGRFSSPLLTALSPRLYRVRGTLRFDPTGVAARVERFGARVNGPEETPIRGTGSFAMRVPGTMQVEFSGFYEKTEMQARARLEAGRLRATLRAPQVTPSGGRSLWSAWPLLQPLALNAELDGSLHSLVFRVTGSARSADSELHVDGTWSARGEPRIDAAATLRAFDLRLLSVEAPKSALDARAQFTLRASDDQLRATLSGTTSATQLATIAIPPLRFELEGWPPALTARLEVLDPSAPVSAELEATASTLSGRANVRDLDLAKQRWGPRGLHGVSSLQAHFTLQSDQVSAKLHAQVRDSRWAGVTLQRLTLDADGSAPWSELAQAQVRLNAKAANLSWGAVKFDTARFDGQLSQSGIQGELNLADRDGRAVRLRGLASLQGRLRNIDLYARRGDLTLEAQVPHFDPTGPELRVASLKLTGPDTSLTGSGRYRPGHLQARLLARNLQLHRIGRPLGWSPAAVTGRADVDMDVTLTPNQQQGRVDITLDGVSFGGWGRTGAHLRAELQDSAIAGELNLQNDLGIGLEGQWDLQLAGTALKAKSWSEAAGSSQLFIHGVDLMALGLLMNSDSVSELEGTLGARLSLHRPSGSRLPHGLFEIGISGLQAQLPALDPDAPTGPLTVYATGAFEARSNALHATVIAEDPNGRLATLSGHLSPNFELLVRDPLRGLHELVHSPLRLSLHLPQRPASQLPWVSRQGVQGQLEAKLDVAGSLADPRLHLWLWTTGLSAPTLNASAALDAALLAHYAPISGQLEVELGANLLGTRAAQGRLTAHLPWDTSPWQHLQTLEGHLELYSLPLAALSPVAELELGGTISGRLEVLPAQRANQPTLAAVLALDEFSSGRAALGTGTLQLEGRPGMLSGKLRLSQGLRQLNVQLGISGPSTTVPFPLRVDDLEAHIDATRLDAAALTPVVGSTVSRLAGRVDGQLAVYLKHVGEGEWRSSISGEANVSQGSAYIAPLGLELRDIRLQATAIPRGNGTLLELQNVTAKARSQRTNVEGRGSFLLHGVRLATGNAQLLLRAVPLTLQGRSLGTASGRLTAQLERRERGWDQPGPHASGPYLLVNAVLDNWRLKAAAAASRPLIDLESKPGIIVLQQEPRAADEDLLPYRFIVELGRDVQVSVAEMELPIGGQLNIAYAGETTLNGTINLERGGRLPLLGRVFQVVDGSLRLNPRNPSNPNIDVTLEGRSADGNPVFVTITGTLDEPVTDPPAAELRELLGGGTATVLSGGVQALGIGQLLGDRVQLRIGTSDEDEETPTYSAAFQLDENLWFEANYQNVTEPSMTQQDGSTLSGTVEYRFRNNWSLRTQIGTAGGSLDLLWQYRY